MSVKETPLKLSPPRNPSQQSVSSSSSSSSSAPSSWSSSSPSVYCTLDNGGNPFQVRIVEQEQRAGITIMNNPQLDYSAETLAQTLIINFSGFFIGRSPLTKLTRRSGGSGSQFDGNSVLLKLSQSESQLTYVFIGTEIFKFEAKAKIKHFLSPVGNSAVPYPYALDEAGHWYLFLEKIVLNKSAKPNSTGNDTNAESATSSSESDIDIEDFPYDWYFKLSIEQRNQQTQPLAAVTMLCERESTQFLTLSL